jgi:hypothetical protein
MNISLPTRISYAVLSGIVVGLVVRYVSDSGALGSLPLYALSGLAFAAGVLLPYLKNGNKKLLRAAGLILASAVSFYCAVWLALEAPIPVDDWLSFTAASLVGAAIVMVASVLIVRIRNSLAFVLLGLFAGVVGGPITFVTLPTDGLLLFVGYSTWHTLICLAIYFGTPSTIAGAKFSAWLARKAPGNR